MFCGQERLVSPNLASYKVGILLCASIENIFDSDCAIDNWYNTAVETARSCFFSVFGFFLSVVFNLPFCVSSSLVLAV